MSVSNPQHPQHASKDSLPDWFITFAAKDTTEADIDVIITNPARKQTTDAGYAYSTPETFANLDFASLPPLVFASTSDLKSKSKEDSRLLTGKPLKSLILLLSKPYNQPIHGLNNTPHPWAATLTESATEAVTGAVTNAVTDKDVANLLRRFTPESRNALGEALWGDIRYLHGRYPNPWGWLMTAAALPKIRRYFLDNDTSFKDEECEVLLGVLEQSIVFWYAVEWQETGKRYAINPDSAALLGEIFYHINRITSYHRIIFTATIHRIGCVLRLSTLELYTLSISSFGFSSGLKQTSGERVFELGASLDKPVTDKPASEKTLTDKPVSNKTATTNKLVVQLDRHLSLLMFSEDSNGHRTPINRFPRAKKGDDKARFKAVKDELNALQKSLNLTYRQLNKHFEQQLKIADVAQRDCVTPRFMQHYFCTHPILKQYAQSLVWIIPEGYQVTAGYKRHAAKLQSGRIMSDSDKRWLMEMGKPSKIHAFIVMADMTWMDSNYESYSDKHIQAWHDESAEVFIATLNELSEQEARQWRELFGDFTLTQPIDQLRLTTASLPTQSLIELENSIPNRFNWTDDFRHRLLSYKNSTAMSLSDDVNGVSGDTSDNKANDEFYHTLKGILQSTLKQDTFNDAANGAVNDKTANDKTRDKTSIDTNNTTDTDAINATDTPVIPLLLYFIESCEQASQPERVVNLIDKLADLTLHPDVMHVIAHFEYLHYLDYLLEHIDATTTWHLLFAWVDNYPIITVLKLLNKLNSIYIELATYPDFANLSPATIRSRYYQQKKVFDSLTQACTQLQLFITAVLTDLYTHHPKPFSSINTLAAAQNFAYYAPVMQPIFTNLKPADTAIAVASLQDELAPHHIAQLSPWLVKPPWLNRNHLVLQHDLPEAIKEAIHLDKLPQPIFKDLPVISQDQSLSNPPVSKQRHGSQDTSREESQEKRPEKFKPCPLPMPLFKNLLKILYHSHSGKSYGFGFKRWMSPLTNNDIITLLSPFTRDSLNELAMALIQAEIYEPVAWLINENALPFIRSYIEKNTLTNTPVTVDVAGAMRFNTMLYASLELWSGYRPTSNFDAKTGRYKPNHPKLDPITLHTLLADAYLLPLLNLLYAINSGETPRFNKISYDLDDVTCATQLNRTELHDLTIPTLGLDSTGQKTFFLEQAHLDSSGLDSSELASSDRKQISVTVDAHLQLTLYDNAGHLLPRFPRVTKADDKTVFAQVRQDINTLQKQLNQIYRQLNKHFKQAMQEGLSNVLQPGRSATFMFTYWAQHPILAHYRQSLLWTFITYEDKKRRYNRNNHQIGDSFLLTDDSLYINATLAPNPALTIAQWQQMNEGSDKDDSDKDDNQNKGENKGYYLIYPAHPDFFSEADTKEALADAQRYFAKWLALFKEKNIVQPVAQLSKCT